MSDIVERLRVWSTGGYKIDPPYMDKAIFYEGDCKEAADEIERLRAELKYEIERLRAERDALLKLVERAAQWGDDVGEFSIRHCCSSRDWERHEKGCEFKAAIDAARRER